MPPDTRPNQRQETQLPKDKTSIGNEVLIKHIAFADNVDGKHLEARMAKNDHMLLYVQCARGAINHSANASASLFDGIVRAYTLGASFAYDYQTTFLQRNDLLVPKIDEQILLSVQDQSKRRIQEKEKARREMSSKDYRKERENFFENHFQELLPFLHQIINYEKGPIFEPEKGVAFLNGADYVILVFKTAAGK